MQRSSSEIRWNSAFVVCEDCGIHTCFCETTTGDAADIAIAIWNRRVEPNVTVEIHHILTDAPKGKIVLKKDDES